MGVLAKAVKTDRQEINPSTTVLGSKPIWWIKLTHWEFWPFNVFYFPIYFYAVWLMIKARSFFFFSASNPGIENGGMLGESKIKIFDKLPDSHKPITHLIQPGIAVKDFTNLAKNAGLSFPYILKPDIGERGWMVKKISNERQLEQYLKSVKVPFLLQELIDEPVELGIFYHRLPGEHAGQITSIVRKEMLTVTGNGRQPVEELLLKNARAAITLDEIKKTSGDILNYIPEDGEQLEVVPIGNHCRGTTFLNGNNLISKKMTEVFDKLAMNYEGFYFGRFDIRCNSISDLENNKFKILELNGCGSEPAHIYQPGYPLIKAYKELIYHLDLMYKIARINHKNGIPYMSMKEGIALIKFLRDYNKNKN